MIINYLDVPCGCIPPDETESKLVINPDAPLSLTVTGKLFQVVVRRHPQGFDAGCRVQHLKFAHRHGGKIREPRHPGAVEQSFRITRLERPDHTVILTPLVSSVNQLQSVY